MSIIRKSKFDLIRKLHLRWYAYQQYKLAKQGSISFICNVCGTENNYKTIEVFDRECETCMNCSSNLRVRTIVQILSKHFYDQSIILPEFSINKSIKGLGMSDWKGYVDLLVEKFDYTNTFYHQEPRLDITNIEPCEYGKYDFVLSSDVLEHIASPVSVGFENIKKLLKPNGICIITVPFMNFEKTLEHFPELHDYKIIETGDGYKLLNKTEKGKKQTFTDLSFHGGGGATLEMRIFTRYNLLHEMQAAGFTNIKFRREENLKFGIYWPVNWSLPITANRPSDND